MMKVLRKKRKGGFTLIELIVVIAILAILAAVAIPRFAGFTEKGKIAADKQYVALVANSATVLLAEGKITATGSIAITPSTGALTLTGLTGATNADFYSLSKMTPLKYYTAVTITISNLDGTYSVTSTPTW